MATDQPHIPLVTEADQLVRAIEGVAAADAGDLVDHEDVVAWVRSWWQANELPTPKSGIAPPPRLQG